MSDKVQSQFFFPITPFATGYRNRLALQSTEAGTVFNCRLNRKILVIIYTVTGPFFSLERQSALQLTKQQCRSR
jgi:hypothetical protein